MTGGLRGESPVGEAEHQPRLVRFGLFEADLGSGELRKAGVKLKLGGQPFQVLTVLLERPGEVVTREQLQQRLWPDTFVDVDHNLNTAINKIREVLGDSAESPRFVETLPRRGYRFIAAVEGGVPIAVQPVEMVPPGKGSVWGRPVYYGLAFLGGLIVAVGVLAIWKLFPRPPASPRVAHFIKLTNDSQAKIGPIVSDGSRIYFTEVLPDAQSHVFQVSVKGGETTPLPVPLKKPVVLDLSKDGTELLVGDGTDDLSLWLQPVAGGSPRRVGTVVTTDARFGASATSILYANAHDIYSVNRDGSSPKKLLTVDSNPFGFRFSPDARTFRFAEFDVLNDTMNIMEAKGDGSGLREVFPGCCGEWVSDGRFFIFQKRQEGRLDFWVVPVERSFPWRKREAKPNQLTAGPIDYQYPLPSKDGKEIFAIGSSRRAEVVRYDAHRAQFVPYLSGISAEGLAFSADGQWVAYTSYPEGLLWRSKVDGTERLQLTFSPMRVHMPRWSPDGKQIAFNATVPEGPWNIYVIPSGGGTAQRILPSDQGQLDVDWAPDGNSLAFGAIGFSTENIYVVDLRSRHVSPLPDSRGLYSPHWSPDGKYISGTTRDGDRLMLFDLSTQKWTEGCGGGVGYPMWSHDGKYIYFEYSPGPDVLYRIARLRVSDRKIEKITEFSNVRMTESSAAGIVVTGTFGQWFGLAPDDSPLLARYIGTQEIYALEMDWP